MRGCLAFDGSQPRSHARKHDNQTARHNAGGRAGGRASEKKGGETVITHVKQHLLLFWELAPLVDLHRTQPLVIAGVDHKDGVAVVVVYVFETGALESGAAGEA